MGYRRKSSNEQKYLRFSAMILFIMIVITSFSGVVGFFHYSSLEEDTIKLDFAFPEPEAEKVILQDSSLSNLQKPVSFSNNMPNIIVFDKLTMDDLLLMERVGEPIVPFKTVKILLPKGRDVLDIKVVGEGKTDLPGQYMLLPGQKPFPLIAGAEIELTLPKPEIYDKNAPFPGYLFEKVTIQKDRGFDILILNLYPLQFNPETGKVVYYKSIHVEVELSPDVKYVTSDRLQKENFRGIREDFYYIEEVVDNPEVAKMYKELRSKVKASGKVSLESLDNAGDRNLQGLIKYSEDEEEIDRYAELKEIAEKYAFNTLNPKIIVELKDPSVGEILRTSGRLSEAEKNTLSSSQLDVLRLEHADFLSSLSANIEVEDELFNVINGFIIDTDDQSVEEIKSLPQVKKVRYDGYVFLTMDESLEEINAKPVWDLDNNLNLCETSGNDCLTGEGQTIAILDSGIDYRHVDFLECDPVELNGEVEEFIFESEHPYPYPDQPVETDYDYVVSRPGYDRIAVHFEIINMVGMDSIEILDSEGEVVTKFIATYDNIWTPSVSGDTLTLRLKSNPDLSEKGYGFKIDKVINGDVNFNWDNCDKFIDGYDFTNNDPDPRDNNGHGTHCASIASAKFDLNGNGQMDANEIWGVAPDSKLYAYKVINGNGGGLFSDIAKAVERATDPNEDGEISDHIDIVSMSLGFFGNPDDLISTVSDNAVAVGISVLVSAGNSGESGRYTIGSPGNAKDVITVGASCKDSQINPDDEREMFCKTKVASFSSKGPTVKGDFKPDILAPGHLICAARAPHFEPWTRRSIYEKCIDDNHVLLSGTSMSCPMAAGATALIRQKFPELDAKEIKHLIKGTADDLGFDSFTQGAGHLNVLSAVQSENLYPVASISLPVGNTMFIGEVVELYGDAYGQGFTEYELQYGLGFDPVSWITFKTSSQEVRDGLLGSINTDSLSEGTINFRIIVRTDAGTTSSDQLLVFKRQPLWKEGWPQMINNDPAFMLFAPVMGDIDNDGDVEVIAGSPNFIESLVYVWSSDGVIEEGWPQSVLPTGGTTPSLGDLDGNGDLEIIYTSTPLFDFGKKRKMYIWNHDGTSFGPAWPMDLPSPGYANIIEYNLPLIDDIDNDGKDEILVTTDRDSEEDPALQIFNGDGTQIHGDWEYPKYRDEDGVLMYKFIEPGVFDINEDGVKEIFLLSNRYFFVYSADGTEFVDPIRHDNVLLDGQENSFMFADINADGKTDVVFSTIDSSNYCIIRVFEYNDESGFTEMPGFPWEGGYNYCSKMSIGNMDFDPELEIAFSNMYETMAIDHTGVKEYDYGFFNERTMYSFPVMVDVDLDSEMEPIFFSGEREPWAGLYSVVFHTMDKEVGDLPGWPKEFIPRDMIQDVTYELSGHSPIVGDLDLDGLDEMVFTVHTGNAFSKSSSIGTLVFAMDLESNGNNEWPMYRQDVGHHAIHEPGEVPVLPECGNNEREGREECDGNDDANCPGDCKADCTCPDYVCEIGEKKCGEDRNVYQCSEDRMSWELIEECEFGCFNAECLEEERDFKYVIITSKEFVNAFQPLIDWKTTRPENPITATIVTVEDIEATADYRCDGQYGDGCGPGGLFDDKQAHIRNFIRDAYQNWGTEYVLLGGDGDIADVGGESGNNIIPARQFWPDREGYLFDWPVASDLYYGCLDGNFNSDLDMRYGEPEDGEDINPESRFVDLFCEVYIGRAAVDAVEEVNNFVSKTIEYEQNSLNDADYLKNGLSVGENLGFGGEAEFGKNFKEEVRLGSSKHGYNTVGMEELYSTDTLYDMDAPWPKENIIDRINADNLHVINHLGHSSVGYVMKLWNDDIGLLTNKNDVFIYSQGCFPGAFDNNDLHNEMVTSYDSIAEHLTLGENGAFAAVMNTRHGWGAPNTDGPSQKYDRQFFDAIAFEHIKNLGRVNQDSKEDNIGHLVNPDRGIEHEFMMWWGYYEITLFGDPETEIYAELPKLRAKIIQPSLIDFGHQGTVDIIGTALGDPPGEFFYYTLKYSPINDLDNWQDEAITLEGNGRIPGDNIKLGTIDTSIMDDGIYNLKLTVFSDDGTSREHIAKFLVNNIHITKPVPYDVYGHDKEITVSGSIYMNPGNEFSIEFQKEGDSTWDTGKIIYLVPRDSSVEDTDIAYIIPSLMSAGIYTIRVKIEDGSGNIISNEYVNKISVDPTLETGWPVKLDYETYMILGLLPQTIYKFGIPQIADLDDDGLKEIIYFTNGEPPELHVFNHDGTEKEGWPFTDFGIDYYLGFLLTTTIADADNDGYKEIYLFEPRSEKFFAIDHEGNLIEGWPIQLNMFANPFSRNLEDVNIIVEDFDSNGEREILLAYHGFICPEGSGSCDSVNIYDFYNKNGELLRSFNSDTGLELLASVINADDDDELEIAVIQDDFQKTYLSIYNYDGTILSGWPKEIYGNSRTPPVVADLDSDGDEEIIQAVWPGSLGGFWASEGLYAFDSEGNSLDGWPVLLNEYVITQPAVLDIDSDGQLEISVIGIKNEEIDTGSVIVTKNYILDYQGNVIDSWPVERFRDDMFFFYNTAGDSDGDGDTDVLTYANNNEQPNIFKGNYFSQAYSFNQQSEVTEGFPKYMEFYSKAPLIIDDIDDDGRAELIGTSFFDADLTRFDGQKNRSSIYVWQLNEYVEDAMSWPTLYHDTAHTSRYTKPISGAPDITGKVLPFDQVTSESISGSIEVCNEGDLPARDSFVSLWHLLPNAIELELEDGEEVTIQHKGVEYTVLLIGVSSPTQVIVSVNDISKSMTLGGCSVISGLNICVDNVFYTPREDEISKAEFSVDKKELSVEGDLDTLKPDECATRSYSSSNSPYNSELSETGFHTIKMEVSCANDGDTSNNIRSRSVNINPDLKPTLDEIESLTLGEQIIVTGNVENLGIVDAVDASISLYNSDPEIDDSGLIETIERTIAVGEILSVEFSWTPESLDQDTLWLKASVNGDTNTNNDIDTEEFILLLPDSPDVTVVFSNLDTVILGEEVTVEGTVSNVGTIEASDIHIEFHEKLFNDNDFNLVDETDIESLALGEETSVEFTWIPDQTGLHVLKMTVETEGDLNPGNDEDFEFVFVEPPPSPDVTLDAEYFGFVVLNEVKTIPVTVTNIGEDDATGVKVEGIVYYPDSEDSWSSRDNQESLGVIEVGDLALGEEQIIEFEWTPTVQGYHDVEFEVQADSDLNDWNNKRILRMIYAAPSGCYFRIKESYDQSEFYVDEPFNLNLEIENIGSEDSVDTTYEAWHDIGYEDELKLAEGVLPDIAIDQTVEETAELTMNEKGYYSFEIFVKASNLAAESSSWDSLFFMSRGKDVGGNIRNNILYKNLVNSVFFEVENFGDVEVNDATAKFYVTPPEGERELLWDGDVGTIQSDKDSWNNFATFNIEYTPEIAGDHLFELEIDCPDDVDLSDNSVSQTIEVMNTKEITFNMADHEGNAVDPSIQIATGFFDLHRIEYYYIDKTGTIIVPDRDTFSLWIFEESNRANDPENPLFENYFVLHDLQNSDEITMTFENSTETVVIEDGDANLYNIYAFEIDVPYREIYVSHRNVSKHGVMNLEMGDIYTCTEWNWESGECSESWVFHSSILEDPERFAYEEETNIYHALAVGEHQFCGDNYGGVSEQCDGEDLKGSTCHSLGFAGGSLSCNEDCTFNTGACTSEQQQPPDDTGPIDSGPTRVRKLEITAYPSLLQLLPGESKTYRVKVKNNGDYDERDVSLSAITNCDGCEFEFDKSNQELSIGSTVDFYVTVGVSEDQETGRYQLRYKADSNRGATDTKVSSIIIGSCNPQENRCSGDNVERCNADGLGWSVRETCAFGCENATCRQGPILACPANTFRCVGVELQECSDTGWSPVMNCSYGCIQNACATRQRAISDNQMSLWIHLFIIIILVVALTIVLILLKSGTGVKKTKSTFHYYKKPGT